MFSIWDLSQFLRALRGHEPDEVWIVKLSRIQTCKKYKAGAETLQKREQSDSRRWNASLLFLEKHPFFYYYYHSIIIIIIYYY